MKKNRALVLSLAIGGLWQIPATAFAISTGTINGQVRFIQGQGGFCPSSGPNARGCTGALYLQSEKGSAVGIAEARVRFVASNGASLGVGASDINGNFSFSWAVNPSSGNKIVVELDHKDSRFLIRSATGNIITLNEITNITVPSGNGLTLSVGTGTIGTAGNPEKYTNIYNGAFREWNNSLRLTNRMLTSFTSVQVLAESTNPNCPTSCASGATKQITLDTAAAFIPQARIMHEMGHIVSNLSDGHTEGVLANQGLYCDPPNITGDTSNNCNGCTTCVGWSLQSTEWQQVAFEEGLATFLGDLGFYNYTSSNPHTCTPLVDADGGDECITGTFNLETSAGYGQAGCNGSSALATDRYLWDIYDDPVDSATTGATSACGIAGTSYTDFLGRDLWEFLETLNSYPDGIANRNDDEHFGTTGRTTYDDRNGRRHQDFYFNYRFRSRPSGPSFTDSTAQICMNCAQPES